MQFTEQEDKIVNEWCRLDRLLDMMDNYSCLPELDDDQMASVKASIEKVMQTMAKMEPEYLRIVRANAH